MQETDSSLTIQQALTDATDAFAATVMGLLGRLTPAQLQTLGSRAAQDAPGYAPPAPPRTGRAARKAPPPRLSALRRTAGTKPVQCPVSGCQRPGVRSKMNFCMEHAEELPRNERVRLRALQKANHRAERLIPLR